MTDKKNDITVEDMHCVDAETGEDIPTTLAEKQEALDALKAAVLMGNVIFSPKALEQMKEKGLTPEQVEAMISQKH